MRLDHIASPSFDPAATHRFYTELLDAVLTFAASGSAGSQRWLVAEYALGDTTLAFLTYDGMTPPRGGDLPDDIRHVAFTVADADALERRRAAFSDAGVRFKVELHGPDDPHLYVYDPNGLVIEYALPWERSADDARRAAATLQSWLSGP